MRKQSHVNVSVGIGEWREAQSSLKRRSTGTSGNRGGKLSHRSDRIANRKRSDGAAMIPHGPQTTDGMYLGPRLRNKVEVITLDAREPLEQWKLALGLTHCRNEQDARRRAAELASYRIVRQHRRRDGSYAHHYVASRPYGVETPGRPKPVPNKLAWERDPFNEDEVARKLANQTEDQRKWLDRSNRYRGRNHDQKLVNQRVWTRDALDRYLHPNRNK